MFIFKNKHVLFHIKITKTDYWCNVKSKTIKNEKKPWDFELGKIFLDMTPNAQSFKEEIDQFDLSKIKNVCFSKSMVKEIKDKPQTRRKYLQIMCWWYIKKSVLINDNLKNVLNSLYQRRYLKMLILSQLLWN